jgi:DNA invertase Pin-like site-specific DNA recombinase
LAAAGVESDRVYSDKLSGTSTRQQRPGLAALFDYAREGSVNGNKRPSRLVRIEKVRDSNPDLSYRLFTANT